MDFYSLRYLSDSSTSPLFMFSIASLKASQPSSPRQLPISHKQNQFQTKNVFLFYISAALFNQPGPSFSKHIKTHFMVNVHTV